ncbi:MAG: DUF1972 domain-containing protein, partial [Bacteroidales bacterium]|nr:DUF1972 domain-containing protein [Bacteroidales bacterium]
MRIGILGSRGIPNSYGGFEQLASHLAAGLASLGNEVVVYSTHHHPYRKREWKGVKIVRCYDPQGWLGPASQLIYDLLCILDSRRRSLDLILQLGYTSSAPWYRLHPRKALVVTHTDGIEWSRSKYRGMLKTYLRWAERKVVETSNALIADSEAIRKHILERYDRVAQYIAYGADTEAERLFDAPKLYGLDPGSYFLSVARFQPDNHQEMIIRAWESAGRPFPLVLVGNTDNRFARRLKREYSHPGLRFTGAVYDQEILRGLRAGCWIYLHGHSGGGTNPSLLEAMADGTLIAAHDNVFNREVLAGHGYFFRNENDLAAI